MYKLRATIIKDIQILIRDKVGLTLMFIMPIVLAIVITAIQNSTFELVNDHKVALLLCNRDSGQAAQQLVKAVEKIGMFEVKELNGSETEQQIADRMHQKDALVALIIPGNFSITMGTKAKQVSGKALNNFGMQSDTLHPNAMVSLPITLLYHPVLQQSFRSSIQGALRSSLQLVENKQILQQLYFSLNEKDLPEGFENDMLNNQVGIQERPISRNGSRNIPNASQHNIPAWTVFAMFFIVISLGSSIVREKLNGSFIRLKTLPTNYMVALISKQITYLFVSLSQAAVIFSIGVWLFPVMGLPALNLPADIIGLLVVSVVCGFCAVSFAICIGVFAQTQEQANGLGAVSIVLLAAIGGILVPSFAMPASFQSIMKISPLHWCLEAYYGLFLEGGKLGDVIMNILPLLAITLVLQMVIVYGLKRKNLI
jgi:ABC-2 type transport system permease protein